MPYTIDWIVDKRVIYLQNRDELTAEDIENLTQQVKTMYQEGIAPIHAIEDDRELKSIKSFSLDMLKSAFEAVREFEPSKSGTAVVIMPSSLEEVSDFFGKLAELVTDIDYERVQSLPEALDILAKKDATLPDKSQWKLPSSK